MKHLKLFLWIGLFSGMLFAQEPISGPLPSIRIIRNADKMTHIAKGAGVGGLVGAVGGFLFGMSSSSLQPTLIGAGIGALIGAIIAYFDATYHSPENHLKLLRELKMRIDMNPELKVHIGEIVNRAKIIYAHSLWPLAASRTNILEIDGECLTGIARSYALSRELEVGYAQDDILAIGNSARIARTGLAERLQTILASTDWVLEVKRYQQHLEEKERQRLQQAALAQKAALAQQQRADEDRRHKEKIALKKYENGLPLTQEERKLLNLER